jgi:hypothetical protein
MPGRQPGRPREDALRQRAVVRTLPSLPSLLTTLPARPATDDALGDEISAL